MMPTGGDIQPALSGPREEGRFLGFRLGDRHLSVATSQVVRVAEVENLHAIPGDLECNLGLSVVDGVAVGILDLERLLEIEPSPREEPWPRLPFPCLFGRFARGVAGFPVDAWLGLEKDPDPQLIVDLSTQERLR